ncbi:hypothetical protein HGRIS_010275 [Hohenbuehelia grisea]|uniref:Chromo domain-containing protein n=1 Tax=Hohenbuehelia grisea TaxID=104357 RepID=A0ABR3J3S8_9AGAR
MARSKRTNKAAEDAAQGIYTVDFIVSAKLEPDNTQKRSKRVQHIPPLWKYRVRWAGYSASDDTWEPPSSFDGAEHFIHTFWKCADTDGRHWKDIQLFELWDEFTPSPQRLAAQKLIDSSRAESSREDDLSSDAGSSAEAAEQLVEDFSPSPSPEPQPTRRSARKSSEGESSRKATPKSKPPKAGPSRKTARKEASPGPPLVSDLSPLGTVLKASRQTESESPIAFHREYEILHGDEVLGQMMVDSFSRKPMNNKALRKSAGDFHAQMQDLPKAVSTFAGKVFDRNGGLRVALRSPHLEAIDRYNFTLIRSLEITQDSEHVKPGIRAHAISQLKDLLTNDGPRVFVFILYEDLCAIEQHDDFRGFFGMHGFDMWETLGTWHVLLELVVCLLGALSMRYVYPVSFTM